jgi:L1 cell adhesion molecule like protein
VCSKAVVYRLGGTSHDATVVQVQNGMYRVLGACTDHAFGSDNFNQALQKYLATEFQRINKADLRDNKRAMAKLLLGAEGCKHTFARLDNAPCNIDSLYDGMDFHANVSR